MKKRIMVTLLVMMSVLMLGACGNKEGDSNVRGSDATTKTQTSANVEASVEVPTKAPADMPTIEQTETNSREQVQATATETPDKTDAEPEAEAEKEDIFASITCSTMWIEEMTAEEAKLSYIDEKKVYDGQTATVVGVMLKDVSGTECVEKIEKVKWYQKEGNDFVEIEEVSHILSDYYTDNVGVIFGRFPKDTVDVNNLYICIEKSEKYKEKYFQIEPDNCLDMQDLNDSSVVVEEPGAIFYMQDIPFMVVESTWKTTGAAGYEDGLSLATEGKQVNFIPLICMSQYDFSITNSSTASGITENEDYVITYQYVWENQSLVGTLLGTEVKLKFELGKIYSDAEKEAFEQQNSYGSFYAELTKEVYGQRPFDNMCIVLENQNREDTQLHIKYPKDIAAWLEEQGK